MIAEPILAAAGFVLYKNRKRIVFKRKWKLVCLSQSKFYNLHNATLKILRYKDTEFGCNAIVELPFGYSFAEFEKDIDKFKEAMRFKSVQYSNQGNKVAIDFIENYKFKDYQPVRLDPNKLLITDSISGPVIVDMNSFPHMLIGGDTGTGKSRLLLSILSNLIYSTRRVDIHLLQLRKNDLGVFANSVQVKSNAKTLEDICLTLSKIDKECLRREELIDNLKGYYSIADYNKANNNRLKYIYVVIEEFSFLNVSKGDIRNEKLLKNTCLKHLKTIVNVGRASGVFLITALQKPTNDSIPSDIKAQLCTRVSLKISDTPTSIVVMGNDEATKLQEREVIVRTLGNQKGFTYTIGHEEVMETIKDSQKTEEQTENISKEEVRANAKTIDNILKNL